MVSGKSFASCVATNRFARHRIWSWLKRRLGRSAQPVEQLEIRSLADLQEIHRESPGVIFGRHITGGMAVSKPREPVLVLGPSGQGKTTGVLIPTVLAWTAPVVSTSTKRELMDITGEARSAFGTIWHFDPMGSDPTPAFARQLRWSPIDSASSWDQAMKLAGVMVDAVPVNDITNASHWSGRAKSLLAPMLLAANIGTEAQGRLAMTDVVRWSGGLRSEVNEAVAILQRNDQAMAANELRSINESESPEERSGAFATLNVVLAAYKFDATVESTKNTNFDAAAFVASEGDSLYITASALNQKGIASIIVAMVNEIVEATYNANRMNLHPDRTAVLFALDEAANIAPLPDLPRLMSEGRGHGLQLLTVFQDVTQAERQWPKANFVSLSPHKLIFRGLADTGIAQILSKLSGEYDEAKVTYTHAANRQNNSSSATAERKVQLSETDILRPREGSLLSMTPDGWDEIFISRYFDSEPWTTVLARSDDVIDLTEQQPGQPISADDLLRDL